MQREINKSSSAYSKAGVNTQAAAEIVRSISKIAKRTYSDRVIDGVGGFGAKYSLNADEVDDLVAVSSTDGVGTKFELAVKYESLGTIGIDLVAMCADDVVCSGARPAFFLDYISQPQLIEAQIVQLIDSLARGCEIANISLVGGELAEHPGIGQQATEFVGFCVGFSRRSELIDSGLVKPGDQLIGLESPNIRSNGFSLVRKVLNDSNIDPLQVKLADGTILSEKLIEPSVIYSPTVLELLQEFNKKRKDVHGICHVTGGGIPENILRVLPEGAIPNIDYLSWDRPEVFVYIQQIGSIPESDMRQVFNLGIGMIFLVDGGAVNEVLSFFKTKGKRAWLIGEINF